MKDLSTDYAERVAVTLFKVCYWHMQDEKVLQVEVNHGLRYALHRELTPELKEELCFEIFKKYDFYLQAHSFRSQKESLFYDPNLLVPIPDSLPGKPKQRISGG